MKVLAVLMVAVIVWGIGDIVYLLYPRLITPPMFLLSISDILAIFGSFLAVLMAFEKVTPPFMLATAAVVLALGLTYWLITRKV